MVDQTNRRPDVAYYYPAPFWLEREGGWIKSLLLFFDKVAILLPDYMYGQHHLADQALAGPLEDAGLLEVLEPTLWIDEEMAHKLAEVVTTLLADGVFDGLDRAVGFQELSQSRIGYGADVDLAESLVAQLQAKGLATTSEDGASIPLHPTVRTTILVILAQIARLAGTKNRLVVHPTTNDATALDDLVRTMSRQGMPSRDNVIGFDLEPVSLNLESVPIDELLQFRVEHQAAHKAYMRDLTRFMAELADIGEPEEREFLFLERRQEIADTAQELQRNTRRTLGRNLPSWSLGIAGCAWSVVSGDVLGAVLATLGFGSGGVVSSLSSAPKKVTAYSYIFQAQRTFAR